MIVISALITFLALARASELIPVEIVPKGDLAHFMESPMKLNIRKNTCTGQHLYEAISDRLENAYPGLQLSIVSKDVKFLNERDLNLVAHEHIWNNKSSLLIHASGKLSNKNFMQVNLFLPLYAPVDQHILPKLLADRSPMMEMNTLKGACQATCSWLKKSGSLPDDHLMLNIDNLSTWEAFLERYDSLEFAQICQMVNHKLSLRNLRAAVSMQDIKSKNSREFLISKSSCFGRQCGKLNVQSEKLKHSVHDLEASLSFAEDDIIRLKKEETSNLLMLDILESKYDSQIDNFKKLNKRNQEVTCALSQTCKQVTHLMNEKESLKIEIAEMESELTELQGKMDSSMKDLGDSQDQLGTALMKITEKDNIIAHKKAKLSQRKSDLEELYVKLESLNDEKRVLEDKNEELEKIISLLDNRIKTLRSELDSTYASKEILQDRLLEKRDELIKCEALMEKGHQEIRKLADGIECLDEQYGVLKNIKHVQSQLIKKLSTSALYGISFMNIKNHTDTPTDVYRQMEFFHARERYQELSDLTEIDVTHLEDDEKAFWGSLYLETFFTEGKRIENWFKVAGIFEMVNTFMFEYCAAADQKYDLKLLREMQEEIERLEKLASASLEEFFAYIPSEMTELPAISELKINMEEFGSGSGVNPAVFAKARQELKAALD